MPITKATASSIAPAAKGDLVVGSATNDASVLAVGSANQVLTVDSSTSTGLKWAAPAGGGKVLQVVSATYGTQTDIASTTMTDTGLSVSITPSATSSKVLILVSQHAMFFRNAKQAAGGIRLVRGATEIFEVNGSQSIALIAEGTGWTDAYYGGSQSMVYLDSPSTTSSTTYKVQAKCNNTANGGIVLCQYLGADSSIIALEIGA